MERINTHQTMKTNITYDFMTAIMTAVARAALLGLMTLATLGCRENSNPTGQGAVSTTVTAASADPLRIQVGQVRPAAQNNPDPSLPDTPRKPVEDWRSEARALALRALLPFTNCYVSASLVGDSVPKYRDGRFPEAWLERTIANELRAVPGLTIMTKEEAFRSLSKDGLAVPCVEVRLQVAENGPAAAIAAAIQIKQFMAPHEVPNQVHWISTFMDENIWVGRRLDTDVSLRNGAESAARHLVREIQAARYMSAKEAANLLPPPKGHKDFNFRDYVAAYEYGLRGAAPDCGPIKEVAVLCDLAGEDLLERLGVTEDKLRVLVEKRVSALGIKVISPQQFLQTLSRAVPALMVAPRLATQQQGYCALSLRLSLVELWMTTGRGVPATKCAPGWDRSTAACVHVDAGVESAMLGRLEDLLKQFESSCKRSRSTAEDSGLAVLDLSGGQNLKSLVWGTRLYEFKRLFADATRLAGSETGWSEWTIGSRSFYGLPAKSTYLFNRQAQLYGITLACTPEVRQELEAKLSKQLWLARSSGNVWKSGSLRIALAESAGGPSIYSLDFAPEFMQMRLQHGNGILNER